MATIFNRKDTSVIQFALNNSIEDFVKEYSNTSASEAALTKAFNEINGNKTKSKIAVKSGQGAPTAPLEAIVEPSVYALNGVGEIEKVDTQNIPTRTDLDHATFTKDGAVESVPESAPKKQEKSKKQTTKTSTSPKNPKKEGELSKRDVIRKLLSKDSTLTNRQVKDAITAAGFTSCYDSEINSCRTPKVAGE